MVALLGALALTASEVPDPPDAGRDVSDATTRVRVGPDAMPSGALGPVSDALGRGDRAFHVRRGAGGLTASNGAHTLEASFSSAGVRVRSGRAEVGLDLHRLGYGDVRPALPRAQPRADANRVSYRRGSLLEWYSNGPAGIEQGFTLDSRPAAPRRGPLTLDLALTGNLSASLERDRDGIRLYGRDVSLRYAGLVASDARGRPLRSWLELHGRELLVRVDDSRARYPIVVDPFVQKAKMTASDAQNNAQFAESVAVSGDTLVVGAPSHFTGLERDRNRGAVYVFQKPAAGWANATETAKLTASDGVTPDPLAPSLTLGGSVAITGDTIYAGGTGRNGNRGAVYVFQKPAGGWANGTETARLTASEGISGDLLGWSVAASGDTVVVGAPGNGTPGDIGSVYVFQKPAAGWANGIETAELTAASPLGIEDMLGTSVAISGDTVFAGAPGIFNAAGDTDGAVYVFQKPATGWANGTETAKLTASDGADFDNLGWSVAAAGDTAVAGVPGAGTGADDAEGALYVFQKPGANWVSGAETAKLTASDAVSNDQLGLSVGMAGDTVVGGAAQDDASKGSAYVFEKPATGWSDMSETARLTASDGATSDDFAWSTAIAGDTIAVGAPSASAGGIRRGAAYVFEVPPDTVPPSTTDDVPAEYRSQPVEVTLSATDTGGSGVDRIRYTTGAAPADPTLSGAGGTTYDPTNKPLLADGEKIRYLAIDKAGNAEAAHESAAAKVDTAAPSTSDDVPAEFRNEPVEVTLSAADTGGSGVDWIRYATGTSPADPTLGGAGGATYDPGTKPVLAHGEKIRYLAIDAAGNAEAVRESTAAKVDTAAPAVSIAAPIDGATYVRGQQVNASYACGDEPGGSALKSCAGPVGDGEQLDTATAGEHSFTVTATDNVGHSTAKTVRYGVREVSGSPSAQLSLLFSRSGVVPGASLRVRCAVTATALRRCAISLTESVAAGSAARRVLGRGSRTVTGAGSSAVVRVRLTRAGRRLLDRRPRAIAVSAVATAEVAAGPALSAHASTTLIRPSHSFTTPRNSFVPNSGALTARGLGVMRGIASSVGQVSRIRCIGYTADLGLGDTRAARRLGLARARAACAELRRLGVRTRHRAITLGPRDPISNNDTDKGRDSNRRVTIEITHAPAHARDGGD